jgi:hypothetical protein
MWGGLQQYRRVWCCHDNQNIQFLPQWKHNASRRQQANTESVITTLANQSEDVLRSASGNHNPTGRRGASFCSNRNTDGDETNWIPCLELRAPTGVVKSITSPFHCFPSQNLRIRYRLHATRNSLSTAGNITAVLAPALHATPWATRVRFRTR